MKKLFMIVTLATGIVVNGFAQQTLSNGGYASGTPATTPSGISQLEVSGTAITQNSYTGTTPPTGQETGNFGTAARWNFMGNLSIPFASQTLNGFRTQTDGRGLAWGHSIPINTGVVANPFIEWIGNNAVTPVVDPGNLEFRYALSSTGAATARVPIFTMAPASSTTPSFNYAETDAFIGQLQSGAFGSFGSGDT